MKALSTRAGQITAILVLLGMVSAVVWPIVEPGLRGAVRDWIGADIAQSCVFIPPSGHVIDSAKAGQWATVTWFNIERKSDCGQPQLTGYLSNGDRIIHTVRLSTTGVNLPIGMQPPISYKFKIPEQAAPGDGFFWVTLNYPQVGRTINSPQVSFTILDE